MSKKKLILLIIIGAVLTYAIFAMVVIYFFNAIRTNPIDKEAMAYIVDDEDNLLVQYGEIKSIGRNVVLATEQSEELLRVPYSVTTVEYRLVVYVNLCKNGNEWEAYSLEVVREKDAN